MKKKGKILIGAGLLLAIGVVVLAAWQVPEVKEVFGVTVYPDWYRTGHDLSNETWK